jgi:hypothetical protein
VRRSRASIWLLLSLMALTGVAIMELQYPISGSVERQADSGEAPAEDLPVALFALGDREAFSETLGRPLFMPDRLPPANVTVEAASPATRAARPNANRYALTAIIIVDNERIALLTDSATGGLNRVREGDSFAGWQVESIHADSAVLSNGDTREELALRTFAAPSTRRLRPKVGEAQAQTADNSPETVLNRPRRPKRGPRQLQPPSAGSRN